MNMVANGCRTSATGVDRGSSKVLFLAVGAIDEVPSIREFMERLVSEAEAIRRRWSIA